MGIFSITIKGTANELCEVQNKEKVKLVDLYYNEKALKISEKESKKLVFINVPEKPDGTK